MQCQLLIISLIFKHFKIKVMYLLLYNKYYYIITNTYLLFVLINYKYCFNLVNLENQLYIVF